jgi:hypothetical protein
MSDPMTEADWLTSTDPTPMLEFLRGKATERKLRLFACACCRHAAHLFPGKLDQAALTVAEAYANGALASEEVLIAFEALGRPFGGQRASRPILMRLDTWWRIAFSVASGRLRDISALTRWLVDHVRAKAIDTYAALRASPGAEVKAARSAWAAAELVRKDEQSYQCELLRDIFGNPFRASPISVTWRSWNGGTVVYWAEEIYHQRALRSMPLLADSLEKAGCADAAILAHCRHAGPHVRGCWVVDLILGMQ